MGRNGANGRDARRGLGRTLALVASAVLVGSVLVLVPRAAADTTRPAPEDPLPTCTEVGGQPFGACPGPNGTVSITASGTFGADGATVPVKAVTTLPPCNNWFQRTVWSPSPCWRNATIGHGSPVTLTEEGDLVPAGSIHTPQSGGSYEITERSIYTRLYTGDTWEVQRCSGTRSNFDTYAYGGHQQDAPWVEISGRALECDLTYEGDRPNELKGATWIPVTVSLDVVGNSPYRGPTSATTWVRLSGDMQNPGPEAAFHAELIGNGQVHLVNDSTHPWDLSLSSEWVLPDDTSTMTSPVVELEPGRHRIQLTVTDPDGKTDTVVDQITVPGTALELELFRVDGLGDTLREGEETPVRLRVGNLSDVNLHDVTLTDVGVSDEEIATLVGPTDDGLIGTLAASGPASVDFADFDVTGLQPGTVDLVATVDALDAFNQPVTGTVRTPFEVKAAGLAVEVTVDPDTYVPTPAPEEGASPSAEGEDGTEVTVTVQIANESTSDLSDVRLTELEIDGDDVEVTPLTGPELDPLDGHLVVDELPAETAADPVEATFRVSGTGSATVRAAARALDEQEVPVRGTGTDDLEPRGEIDYTVPDRIERPEPGEVPDLPDTPGEVDDVDGHEYPVDVELVDGEDCEADLDWYVDGELLDEDPTPTEEPCTFRVTFEDEGEFAVDVERDDTTLHSGTVTVDDVLWVVIGDSVASGEGNPHLSPGGGRGRWIDEGCHRSARSGAVEAAYDWEAADDQSSVTLVHLACSGATVQRGLLGPQERNPFFQSEAGPHQLAVLEAILGERKPDVVVLQIGGNDMLFGPATRFCIGNGTEKSGCQHVGFAATTSVSDFGNVEYVGGIPYPEEISPFTGSVCSGERAGSTQISVAGNGEITERGEGWGGRINADDVDFSGREPFDPDPPGAAEPIGGSGPSESESVDVDAVTATTCLRVGAQGLPLGNTPGVRLSLDSGLEYNHFSGYAPEIKVPPPPVTEAVLLQPPDLDDAVREAAPEFSVNLQEVGRWFRAHDIDDESIYAVQYYDPTTGPDGEVCEKILAVDGGFFSYAVQRNEAVWARNAIIDRANRTLEGASGLYGWNYVDGPVSDFQRLGYCAPTGVSAVVNDPPVTQQQQGDFSGLLHPNARGHELIARRIFDAAAGQLGAPDSPAAPDGSRSYDLASGSDAGSSTIRLGSDDPAGTSADRAATSVLARAATSRAATVDVAVGDWLVVGANNELTADHELALAPSQVVEVLAVDGDRVTVGPELADDHLAAEKVVLVTDRDLVEDPYPDGTGTDPTPAPGDDPGGAPVGSGTLARTGSDTYGLTAVAVTLVLAGGVVLLVSRQRRRLGPTGR